MLLNIVFRKISLFSYIILFCWILFFDNRLRDSEGGRGEEEEKEEEEEEEEGAAAAAEEEEEVEVEEEERTAEEEVEVEEVEVVGSTSMFSPFAFFKDPSSSASMVLSQ